MTEPDRTSALERIPTGLVPIAKIQRDERVNTRPIDWTWVRAHEETFNPFAVGVPVVSRRADGTCIVLDGQNRIELIKACGHEDSEILCEIYEGLELKQEAKLFDQHNDRRNVRPGYRFLARITQEDPVAVAIGQVVSRAGWEIAATPRKGALTAVATLENLWNNDRRHYPTEQPFVLENTLHTITQAWAHTDGAQDAAIIKGIGLLYVKHGLAVDPGVMAAQLADYPGGPAKLLNQARGLKGYKGGGVAHSVAELVTTEYNRGRPPRRLPKYR